MNIPDDRESSGSEAAVSTGYYPSLHWSVEHGWTAVSECVAAEAPLAIEIGYERSGQLVNRVLGVTMRTPGDDAALATGFLLSEGLIDRIEDITDSSGSDRNSLGESISTWRIGLARAPQTDLRRVKRESVTNSACGLCGRKTLAGLPLLPPRSATVQAMVQSCEGVLAMPDALRQFQATFAETGGVHGAALFDGLGRTLLVREDVGRHNAVDKLVGRALLNEISPAGKVLVLSGRVSFELMQKAAAAGVAMVVAVGAPSSLAVDLAHFAGITLVGFVRSGRFNVYTHADRLSAQGHTGTRLDLI